MFYLYIVILLQTFSLSTQSQHREYAIWSGCILERRKSWKNTDGVHFWWYPGNAIPVTIQYFGYRSSVLDVHRSISPLIVADDIIHFDCLD